MPARQPNRPAEATRIAQRAAAAMLAEARALFPDVQVVARKARDPFNESKKGAFLLCVAQCGRISKAAELVGVSPNLPYIWRKRDPAFREALDEPTPLDDDDYVTLLIHDALRLRQWRGGEP